MQIWNLSVISCKYFTRYDIAKFLARIAYFWASCNDGRVISCIGVVRGGEGKGGEGRGGEGRGGEGRGGEGRGGEGRGGEGRGGEGRGGEGRGGEGRGGDREDCYLTLVSEFDVLRIART